MKPPKRSIADHLSFITWIIFCIVITLMMIQIPMAQAGTGTQMYIRGDLDDVFPVGSWIVIIAFIAWILNKLFNRTKTIVEENEWEYAQKEEVDHERMEILEQKRIKRLQKAEQDEWEKNYKRISEEIGNRWWSEQGRIHMELARKERFGEPE